MRYFIFFLCVGCLAQPSFSQHSTIDFCEVYKHVLRTSNLDTISHLLSLDATQITPYEKAELYSIRGRIQLKWGEKKVDKKENIDMATLRNAYEDFSTAINQTENEYDKLNFTWRRFLMLEEHEPRYNEYLTDLYLLNSNGYKKDKFGMGLTFQTRYDDHFWLGAEFSLFSGYGPHYTLKDGDGSVIDKKRYSKSASAFVFAYARNFETEFNDFNFTILRIEAPLFINLTQIGFIQALDSNHWYYRPELGIGYSIFQLSAGYTLFFRNKSESLPNALVSLRIKHTF